MAAENRNPSGVPTDSAEREIVISRVLDAPRELVFSAWSDPEHVGQWWGPNGFTTTTGEMDFRAGGVWRFVMHGPDGRDYQNRIVFNEVVAAERLVYTHDGGEQGVETVNFHTTVTFEQAGDPRKTKLTLRMVFPSAAERDRRIKEYGAVDGGIETVGRLAEHLAKATGSGQAALTLALPSEREVILQRTFDVPRRLVFEAFTKPEHMRRWWGRRTHTMPVCEMDFRPGGEWRFVQRTPNGHEHPFKGVYKEIAAPERIVQTFVYDVEGIRDRPAIETITFEERDGRTILRNTMLHASREDRDGHLFSGMEAGAAESMDRLAELAESMARDAATTGATV